MSKYNEQPKGWKEIPAHEFAHLFFMYIFKEPESRQIHYDHEGNSLRYDGNAKLFEVEYSGWEGMGVAMRWHFKIDHDAGEMRYFRYGEDERWTKNERTFAAQFAGDNS